MENGKVKDGELPQGLERGVYAAINKILPDGKTFPYVYCIRVETALQHAHQHYTPIIAEKEREIERITGLLRAEVYDKHFNYYMIENDIEEDEEVGVFEAEAHSFKETTKFCEENNIPN